MKNEDSLIGLFQGMFEENILTFNPGWNCSAENIDKLDDVREIQKSLKADNVDLINETDGSTEDPASIVLVDPDENTILIDKYRQNLYPALYLN